MVVASCRRGGEEWWLEGDFCDGGGGRGWDCGVVGCWESWGVGRGGEGVEAREGGRRGGNGRDGKGRDGMVWMM